MEHRVIWGRKQLNSNYDHLILCSTFSSNFQQEVNFLTKRLSRGPGITNTPSPADGVRGNEASQVHTDQDEGSDRRKQREQPNAATCLTE